MSKQFKQIKRVIALVLITGALPFVMNARAQANEWLDDYRQPVGLTYGAKATLNANYLWRSMYAGGMSVQLDANVGYGGLYADLWWNLGVTDWTFSAFQPEVDISIGFARWGLNVFLLYIHNFNSGFFDFGNYPDKGNRLEVNVSYTVSKRLPLSILWATRVGASDGYLRKRVNETTGERTMDTVQAYSSYAEISYTQVLPFGLSLYGAFGITPWRSCYTHYRRDFAVQNIEIALRKDWEIAKRCGLMIKGTLCLNPSSLAANPDNARWHPDHPWEQGINANIAAGVYLK